MVIMPLKKLLGKIFRVFDRARRWSEEEEPIYDTPDEESEKGIYALWDFLRFAENTQAYHLINVIGFEEWIDMEEIRRRIKEIFSIEYKNEKSLYPYLKTLTDINLFETTNIGGRKKWRKKELLFELETEKVKEGKKEKIQVKIKAREKKRLE